MRFQVKAILGAILCAAMLFAAGCGDEPAGESSSESSTAVSQTSSAAEESSVISESSAVSSEDSVIALPSEDSTETESSEETSSEESSTPAPRPIFRDDEEPHLEEIVLPAIEEKGFALLQGRLTMELGEQTKIPFEFTPIGTTNRALTWTSTNTKAVTVSSDGTLTAVGTGITYIRATTSTGRYSECKVEVVAELPLSALAKRIKAVASGEFGGKYFALCDVDLDGVQELIVRTTPAKGLPSVGIYEIEVEPVEEPEEPDVSEDSQEPEVSMPEGWVIGFDTGDDEEWAVWERKDGTRFLLVSFSQNLENGDVHHVMLEVNLSEPPAPETGEEPEEPALQCVYILTREVHNGESRYFAQIDGAFAECDNDTYQSVRSAYFSAKKQLSGYALKWVSGNDPKEIENELEELSFAKK